MTEGSIKKNFDVVLVDLAEGGDFIFNGKPLTAKRAIQLAFFNPARGDESNPDSSVERYRIGILLNSKDAAFTPEDLSAIRFRIRRYWTAAMLTGQIEAIIDSKD